MAEPMISLEDLDNLRHMLGAKEHIKRRDWGYRNHFAPSAGNIQSMDRLEIAGLVVKGGKYNDYHMYHATEEGCKVAGLNKAQTKRALQPE